MKHFIEERNRKQGTLNSFPVPYSLWEPKTPTSISGTFQVGSKSPFETVCCLFPVKSSLFNGIPISLDLNYVMLVNTDQAMGKAPPCPIGHALAFGDRWVTVGFKDQNDLEIILHKP